ncbi:variable surface protein Vir12 [Plasmodium vivax Brazil I]|uniref:Variable surface protein Vir12 n=1 Tax=Plasmodium vivax (strain Brazil I) TaxID=1033975 RepID=A0A0J9STB0_PLAV1|nr:variable surface protein Vir12 [Plasmodium vivax Brazil I]
MGNSIDEGDFYELAKKATDLKESYSYKKYEELDKDVGTEVELDEKCSSVPCNSTIISESLLKKIKRNVKALRDIKVEKEYRENCLNYKYWIFGEMWKLYNVEKKSQDISNIIAEFMKLNGFFNDGNSWGCEFNFIDKDPKDLILLLGKRNLYDYFKNHHNIKKSIACKTVNNDLSETYLKSISETYKKYQSQEECCHWGASFCPDYFLSCDDVYNPSRLLSLLNSKDGGTCDKVGKEDSHITGELKDSVSSTKNVDMYIKYLRCAKVTEPTFNQTAIVCQQPGYRPHLSNSLMDRKRIGEAIDKNSTRPIHQLRINEKPVNVVLISSQDYNYYNVTSSNTYTPEGIYTLFPEITGNRRKDYEKEGEDAKEIEEYCKKDKLPKHMKLYCQRSKKYSEYFNKPEYKNETIVELNETIPEVEDEPISTSFFTAELLKTLPFRASVMVTLSLGVIMVFFMYYKVKNNSLVYKHLLSLFFINFYELFYYEICNLLCCIYFCLFFLC